MPLDNMSQDISVLVADDHPVFREGLRLLLETDPKIHVVGEARDGKEAAALASELKPSLLLMDLRMPRCSGMEALRLIQRLSIPVRILILATEVRKTEVVEALSYGASGVVLKETATQLLRKSIYTVMAGQYWIEREGVVDSYHESATEHRVGTQEVSNKNWRLTPREEEIVAEVVSGKTNNEIAQTLGVSAQTVKHHLTSIFDKVGVYNRLELALFCYSYVSDGNQKEGEPASATPSDRTNIPNGIKGPSAPKTVEPIRVPRTDRDTHDLGMRPQVGLGAESTAHKRMSSRNMQ
jgi:DNA-binding NarL/FixJ family response regulator